MATLPVPYLRCSTPSRTLPSWITSKTYFHSVIEFTLTQWSSMDLPVDLSRVLFVCTGAFLNDMHISDLY